MHARPIFHDVASGKAVCYEEGTDLYDERNTPGFSAFGLFWGISRDGRQAIELDNVTCLALAKLIRRRSNRLDALCLAALKELHKNPDNSVHSRVNTISQVRQSQHIRKTSSADYYDVENSFIHLALEGHGSLPITLDIIFVACAAMWHQSRPNKLCDCFACCAD
jgi:hypothetical protein